jgi:hypothetical protein
MSGKQQHGHHEPSAERTEAPLGGGGSHRVPLCRLVGTSPAQLDGKSWWVPLREGESCVHGSGRRGSRWTTYHGSVSSQQVPGGVVHQLPADLRTALIANTTALDAWKGITPLARNEFICWVEDAKQETTRERRIRRTQEELEEGQRRPCCWPGCTHRERTGR